MWLSDADGMTVATAVGVVQCMWAQRATRKGLLKVQVDIVKVGGPQIYSIVDAGPMCVMHRLVTHEGIKISDW